MNSTVSKKSLGSASGLKLDLLFEGIRYTRALGEAARDAFPNFYPYRFAPGEEDPTGEGKAVIPYLIRLDNGTVLRIKGAADSAWHVECEGTSGYVLLRDGETAGRPVTFEPLPRWMAGTISDGFPMAQAGISLHSDMAVINVAPGCEYFLHKEDKVSMRCTFCAYGAPDARTRHLGQEAGVVSLPRRTYDRLHETLDAVLEESRPRHLYLVGGSMPDWREEAARYLELARAVQETNQRRVPVACGSGALPNDAMDELHGEDLAQSVSFNLEVWSRSLFERICPGKNRYVGYENWLAALEYAVRVWGPGRVYTAMVAGVELEPEYGLSWERAADIAIEGAEDLCRRGIIPIYSLYWPVGGREHPEYMSRLRGYFERLTLGYQEIRARHELAIWDGFMCCDCAYMQLECDVDRETRHAKETP